MEGLYLRSAQSLALVLARTKRGRKRKHRHDCLDCGAKVRGGTKRCLKCFRAGTVP